MAVRTHRRTVMRSRPGRPAPRVRRFRDVVDDFAAVSPARFAILIFTSLIVVLTLVLSLPIAARDRSGTPLADALFTAVSTICVTGLSTVDMATHWSVFGNVAILIGLQVGGIGVLTLASIMGLVVSRRLGLRTRLMAASDSNPSRIHHGPVSESQAIRLGEMGGLLATVALSALIIEVVVAITIYPRLLAAGFDGWTAVWQSFYYAASAFTNTGFTPNPDGLAPFTGDPWMLSMLALAVFLGSLGFPVIFALARGWRNPKRWSVHVKLTLTTTLGLIVLGGIALTLLEWNNLATLGAQDPAQRPLT